MIQVDGKLLYIDQTEFPANHMIEAGENALDVVVKENTVYNVYTDPQMGVNLIRIWDYQANKWVKYNTLGFSVSKIILFDINSSPIIERTDK